MQKILVKTTSDPYLFQWMKVPELGFLVSSDREFGTLAELRADLDELTESSHIVFLVPAMSVHVRQLSFDAVEKKHLAKTVPFTLEDEMICDASDLHCVMMKPKDNRVWVAAIQHKDLDRWLKHFEEAGLELSDCFPEQVLLLDDSDEWSLYYDNNEFLIRCGEPQIHGLDSETIALALDLSTNGFTELPPAINLFVNESADSDDALLQIPSELHPYIETEANPLPAIFSQRLNENDGLSFLQGAYSGGTNFAVHFEKWKRLMWLFLLGLFVHAGVSFAEYQKSNSELSSVRGQIKTLYKQVSPNGKTRNARKSVESELKRYEGSNGSSVRFLETLVEASSAIEKQAEYKMKTLSYSAQSGLELDVFLKNQSSVETLKSELQSKGFEVTLLKSSGQDNQVRARMNIKRME